jgi:hypothetical protein
MNWRSRRAEIKATANYFHNLSSTARRLQWRRIRVNTFDGLKKLLSGTSNEITSEVQITTAAELTSNSTRSWMSWTPSSPFWTARPPCW